MSQPNDHLAIERGRLERSPSLNEKPGGFGTVRFVVQCPNVPSDIVLERVLSVLRVVDGAATDDWPSIDSWRQLLPSWFVQHFAADQSKEAVEEYLNRWRTMTRQEQAEEERTAEWTLRQWLYAMEHRVWYWWDSHVPPEPGYIFLAVEAFDWPFGWGELRWLFRAAGAFSVEAEV
jgi:hypothetical protein